jgi:hypothetical protein
MAGPQRGQLVAGAVSGAVLGPMALANKVHSGATRGRALRETAGSKSGVLHLYRAFASRRFANDGEGKWRR